MSCWESNCSARPTFVCPCSGTGVYSCEAHLIEHLKLKSQNPHQPEPQSFNSYSETKQVICDYLMKRNSDLSNYQSRVIDATAQKIKQLKSQLEVAIDEFQRVIKENTVLIEKVILAENLPKNDEINKILFSQPDEALKIISTLSWIDKEKLPDYIQCKFDSPEERNEINIFRDNTKKLLRVNLNDLSHKEIEIPIEHNATVWLSICKLPDNNLFCFQGINAYSSPTFMIYEDNSIRYLTSRPNLCRYASAIYYENEVYSFGGNNDFGYVTTPEKYNISENKWYKIPQNLSVGSISCNGFSYKDKIFFVGLNHAKIYIYHVSQNKYSEIPINLTPNAVKILHLIGNCIYVIESNSKIYEIDADDIQRWRIAGTSPSFGRPVSHFVQLKNSVYFMDNNSYIMNFDLASKSVRQVKQI
ncbi:unnamed protein product [Blepharisma stoltei]|uniref:Uncharacterized protein n=1 Tax=Blepharisma stoltei TaxID=1481888 RepID=A0AAU9IL34_9CILI|nr:unnamed protein product [Blepharisma stoltei]